MMKLDGIATFVAVADAGSISAAGRLLGLSKSVVSERLSELERLLGGRLVNRTTRRLTLTEDGQAFLERARRIVRDSEEAAAEMAARRGQLVGRLRISGRSPSARCISGRRSIPSWPSIRASSWRWSSTTASWTSPARASTR
ncbi:MAG: LysR family transcriptional regulator [Rubritepida sp.]|nr:LysR family transcriptional regulator [Rubritepida sp.]